MDDKHEVEFCLYYGTMGLSQFQILNNTLTNSVGHVDFTADNSGSYTACVSQISSDDTEVPTVSTFHLIIVQFFYLFLFLKNMLL